MLCLLSDKCKFLFDNLKATRHWKSYSALWCLAEPIEYLYVSLILWMDIPYANMKFGTLMLSISLVISMLWFYGLNITFSSSKPITNIKWGFILYTPQNCVTLLITKEQVLLDKYWRKWSLQSSSWNLFGFSWVYWKSCTHAQREKHCRRSKHIQCFLPRNWCIYSMLSCPLSGLKCIETNTQ